MTVPIPADPAVFAVSSTGRDVYYSDLLKIKKLFLPLVDGDQNRVRVRQDLDDITLMRVELHFGEGVVERYDIRIVEAAPLPPDEYGFNTETKRMFLR